MFFPSILDAETLSSDNFILTDSYGNTTAQLTKSGEGTPALFFYDKNHTPRISIGLYGDGVPGIVINDEKWLATGILRMVNNQWDPVLVLKEYGQDKVIIDKNGFRNASAWDFMAVINMLITGLAWGFIGGFVAVYIIEQRKRNMPVSFGSSL